MKNVSFMRNGKEFKPTRAELERVFDDYAERLALTEKALELACADICSRYFDSERQSEIVLEYINDFKAKAKEIMKSE